LPVRSACGGLDCDEFGAAHSHPPADPSEPVKNRGKLPLPASIRGNLELRNGEGECIIWGALNSLKKCSNLGVF